MPPRKSKPPNGEPDAALGRRIRELRRAQGDTQSKLGEKLGLTYQQVQKYENGANRISALMLIKVADALGTTPTNLLSTVESADPRPTPIESDRLVDAFARIRSSETREAVVRIVEMLASAGDDSP